jgi:hypothetical protein
MQRNTANASEQERRNDAASDHVNRTFKWLDQVDADLGFENAGAFLLAYTIAKGINRHTGMFFAARDTLADKVGCDPRSIVRLVKLLENRGHLSVKRSPGRGHATEYRLIWQNADQRPDAHPTLKGDIGVTLNSDTGVTLNAQKVTSMSVKRDTGVIPTPLNIPHSKNIRGDARSACAREQGIHTEERQGQGEAFEAFWQSFPNRVGRDRAEKAFKQVWASGVDLDILIVAAKRYAASKPAKREWLNPSTWLNDRRWNDEPAPIPETGSGSAATPRPRRNSYDQRAQRNADAYAALMSLPGGRYAN